MEPTISISQFKRQGLNAAQCFGDDLIITNEIEHLEQLRYPCRIDAITILICLEGNVDCRINLHDYHIGPRGILINFPENIIQIERQSHFRAYALLISSDYERELQLEFRQRLSSYIDLRDNPLTYAPIADIIHLRHYYTLLHDSITAAQPEAAHIIRGLTNALVYEILGIINRQRQQHEDLYPSKVSHLQFDFERFMSLVAQHHLQQRAVKFYATQMSLTPNYLTTIVKDYSGRTASQWIDQYVVLEAKTMLRFSGLSIQEIAYRLNFPNQSTFGKYFKKQTGLSPSNYINS